MAVQFDYLDKVKELSSKVWGIIVGFVSILIYLSAFPAIPFIFILACTLAIIKYTFLGLRKL